MTDVAEKISARQWQTKVPVITAIFWVIKLLSTTVGETFADYLAVNVGLGPGITDAAMLIVLATAMTIQLRTRRYTPWIYWLCVVLVSIVGTQITDFFTDTLGVSLYLSTAVFAVMLTAVFISWYRQERTLAISSIDTRRREVFYWGAVLVTFALGTAAGDLATEALSLGFRNGVILFSGLIAATYLAYRLGASAVATFWVGYVLTRPLGASLGDLLSQDKSLGGLGLGASLTSVMFLLVIVILVAREQYLITKFGVVEKGAEPHGGRRKDIAWASAGAAAVLAAGLVLTTITATPADTVAATAVGGNTGTAALPTTPLGDLTEFATITSDVKVKVAANDLPGAVTRVKDLEVAWDSSEAGLKPRDPADWHTVDGQIDTVLTTLRSANPSQADSAKSLDALLGTLDTFDGK